MTALRSIIQFFSRATSFLVRHKRRLTTFALVFGFVIDVITFRTIDLSWSRLILSIHLGIVAGAIIIAAIPPREGIVDTIRAWTALLHQYSTGALLSAFLVLYSASGSLQIGAPFFILLVIAIIGNEVLVLRRYRIPFQITLFTLNVVLFCALFVPYTLGTLGVVPFLIAITLTLVAAFLLTFIVSRVLSKEERGSARWARRASVAIVLGMCGFYFAGIIPPIPLTMKEHAFYYAVEKRGDVYVALQESKSSLEEFLGIGRDSLTLRAGDEAYFFVSVFAPARLETPIVHRWERKNLETGEWETMHQTQYSIVGGRRAGYRGYSISYNPLPGRWRVSVETVRGQVIGRSHVSITYSDSIPLREEVVLR